MNIEIIYGDHEPDLVSQSLTGRASTSLGSGALVGQALSGGSGADRPREPWRPRAINDEVFQRTGGLLWAIAAQSKAKPGRQQRCSIIRPWRA